MCVKYGRYQSLTFCFISESVLKDGKAETLQFRFPLSPGGSILFLQSLLSECFQLDVGLRQLGGDLTLVGTVHLANGIAIVSLMPFGVASDSSESIGEVKVRA